MISGGRDSVCLLDVAVAVRGAENVRALHVNYGLRGRASYEDERYCAELCSQLGVWLELVRVGEDERRRGQSAGVGARAPLRGGKTAGGRTGRACGDGAHGERPGRDDPVPVGGLAGSTRAAGDVRARGVARAAAAGGDARADGRVLRSAAGCSGAKMRATTTFSTRACACASCSCRRCARCIPRRRRTCGARRSCCARRPICSTGLVASELGGRDSIALARLGELHPALARLIVVRLAEDAAGELVPQAGARVAEILALGARGGVAEVHVGGNVGARIADGELRMVKLPHGD